MSLWIDSAEENQRVLGSRDQLNIIEYAIQSSKNSQYSQLSSFHDKRFESFSLLKAHGCSAYSLKVFCASSSESFFNDKICKPLVFLTLPFFHAVDSASSLVLGTLQLAVSARNAFSGSAVFLINKVLSKEDAIEFTPPETTALKTYVCAFESLMCVLAEIPVFISFHSWGDLLKTGFWAYSKEGISKTPFVDQSKLDWILRKYTPYFGLFNFDKKKLSPFIDQTGIYQHINSQEIWGKKPTDGTYIIFSEKEGESQTEIKIIKQLWQIAKSSYFGGLCWKPQTEILCNQDKQKKEV